MTAEQKKKIDELHAKYYGKGKAKTQEPKATAKALKKSNASESTAKGPSRNELMLQAKAKGIKNFRIINKEELVEILREGTSKERTDEIVAKAVARWKSSWGKGKRKEKKEK